MPETAFQVGLVTAVAAVLLAPVVRRVVRRRFDPFEPIVLFAVAYGVMFVARPAWMLAHQHLAYDSPRSSMDVSATFSEMLVLALVGAIAFVVGYELGVGRRLVRRSRSLEDVDSRRVILYAFIAAALGITSFVVFLSSLSGSSTLTVLFQGRSPDVGNAAAAASFYVWFSFFLLVPATLVLLAVGVNRRSRALLMAAFALTGLVLLATVPIGARITLLPFIGALFVLYYVRRSARPSTRALVLTLAVALLTSAFLSDLRGRSTRDETVAETIVRATRPSRVVDGVLAGPDSEMAPALAAALGVIPERVPHTYGQTIFGDLVSRPIPRALWDAKPAIPRKQLIARLWPVESERGTINTEFSSLLYFYWDFGVLGVGAGFLLFGIGARLLFEYFIRHPSSLAVQLLFSLGLWFVVIALRDSPVDTFVRAMFVVLPAWLIFRLATQPVVRASPIISK